MEDTDIKLTINQKIALIRLQNEVKYLKQDKSHCYQIIQDEDDKFLFYFLLRGNDDSHYKGGYYLGKIIVPLDYPRSDALYYMLTPNGRFQTNTKICLSHSRFVALWNDMKSIGSSIAEFYWTFLNDDTRGISHIKETSDQRKIKADSSALYNQTNYPHIFRKFDQYFKADGTMRTDENDIKNYIKSLETDEKID